MTAARLLHHPSWTPGDLIADFEEAGSRLDALSEQENAVATAFELSYRALNTQQQRLFRLLGAHPGIEYAAPDVAALLDVDPSTARRLLAALEEHRLLDETAVRGRYRMHDLLREHAATLAANNSEESLIALTRLLAYYQEAAELGLAAPTGPSRERALSWMRVERENLLACINYAARHGDGVPAVRLTAAIAPLLVDDGPWIDSVALHTQAAGIARSNQDLTGLARALKDLCRVRQLTGDYASAVEAAEHALDLYRQIGDRDGQADALNSLSWVRRMGADYPEAVEAAEQALDLYRQIGNDVGLADALNTLSRVLQLTGDEVRSKESAEESLALYRQLDLRDGQADALNSLILQP